MQLPAASEVTLNYRPVLPLRKPPVNKWRLSQHDHDLQCGLESIFPPGS